MKLPGSRALLADGFVSSGRVLGQALFGCFPLPLRKLSPVSSMRWALWMRRSRMTPAQEAVAVVLRKTLLVSLDDLLAVVREFLNPEVSRSGLDRSPRT